MKKLARVGLLLAVALCTLPLLAETRRSVCNLPRGT